MTGHMHLSWDEAEKLWRIQYWKKSDNSRTTDEGADPFDGGATFAEQLGSFWSEWQQKQQAAIDVNLKRTSCVHPTSPFTRRGFRAVTMSKEWGRYRASVSNEALLIERDVNTVLDKIHAGGWSKDRIVLTIPQLIFLNPWGSKGLNAEVQNKADQPRRRQDGVPVHDAQHLSAGSQDGADRSPGTRAPDQSGLASA